MNFRLIKIYRRLILQVLEINGKWIETPIVPNISKLHANIKNKIKFINLHINQPRQSKSTQCIRKSFNYFDDAESFYGKLNTQSEILRWPTYSCNLVITMWKEKKNFTKLPIKRSNLVQSWLSPHSKFKQLVELTMGAFSGLASTVAIHLFFSPRTISYKFWFLI